MRWLKKKLTSSIFLQRFLKTSKPVNQTVWHAHLINSHDLGARDNWRAVHVHEGPCCAVWPASTSETDYSNRWRVLKPSNSQDNGIYFWLSSVHFPKIRYAQPLQEIYWCACLHSNILVSVSFPALKSENNTMNSDYCTCDQCSCCACSQILLFYASLHFLSCLLILICLYIIQSTHRLCLFGCCSASSPWVAL